MRRSRPAGLLKTGLLLALVASAAGTFIGVRSASAADGKYCEKNACMLSAGNCDLVANPFECRETAGGCEDNACEN